MPARIKSALFVDFDNIYIGLKQDDPRAAEEFGRGVRHWLRWIETRMPVPLGDDGQPATRSILVRRCYGNPETFSNYRGWFTRSGFTVVDCPPLTGAGKNSADIVMVMDVLDVLNHQTHFDEFIIMSADADFTPLVLRLRAHDRRTAAIVAGNAAAAYKASCDLVVPSDVFVHRALQVDVPRSPSLHRPERPRYLPPSAAAEPPLSAPAVASTAAPASAPGGNGYAPRASAEVLDAIARRLHEAVEAAGELPGSRIPEILREFPEFTPRSNWLGFYSLRSLTQELISRYPGLHLTSGDKWSVAIAPAAPPRTAPDAAPPRPASPAAEALRDEIVRVVREVVAASDEPVVMARAAQAVITALGPRVTESHWAGAGQFRALLEQVPDLGLEMRSQPQPGYILDPARHHAPTHEAHDELGEVRDELASFIRRIGGITGAPRLTPRQYGVLFRLIAEEVEKAPYALALTSSTVRERAAEMDEHLTRIAITFVLRGISFAGYRYRRTGVDEARALADAFRGNLLNLIRAAQVVLDEHELELLDEWLLSGTAAAPPSPEDVVGIGQPPEPAVAAREEEAPPIEPLAHETPADAEAAQAPWTPEPEPAREPKPWDRALADEPASPWAADRADQQPFVTADAGWAGGGQDSAPPAGSPESPEAVSGDAPGSAEEQAEEARAFEEHIGWTHAPAEERAPAAEDDRWEDSPLKRWFDEWAQTPAEDRASADPPAAFAPADDEHAPADAAPRPPSRARLGSALPHGTPPAELVGTAAFGQPQAHEEPPSAEPAEEYPPTESGELEVPPPIAPEASATSEDRAEAEPVAWSADPEPASAPESAAWSAEPEPEPTPAYDVAAAWDAAPESQPEPEQEPGPAPETEPTPTWNPEPEFASEPVPFDAWNAEPVSDAQAAAAETWGGEADASPEHASSTSADDGMRWSQDEDLPLLLEPSRVAESAHAEPVTDAGEPAGAAYAGEAQETTAAQELEQASAVDEPAYEPATAQQPDSAYAEEGGEDERDGDFGWLDEMTYAPPAIETAEHAEAEVVATHGWDETPDAGEPEPAQSPSAAAEPEPGSAPAAPEPWEPIGPWGVGEPPPLNEASAGTDHAADDAAPRTETQAPGANPNAWQLWPPFSH
jgi:hypothetical protein